MKFIDFGLAIRILSDDKLESFAWTRGFIAPEVSQYLPNALPDKIDQFITFHYREMADVFSLGMVVIELFTRRSSSLLEVDAVSHPMEVEHLCKRTCIFKLPAIIGISENMRNFINYSQATQTASDK